ncbi:NADH-quinone oxidoreductase subunit A [Candidatus Poribacteria bacterium]|nr:NADH-quinone oxidoreductase subunit A [Candidatus Poribacteria bacterium]
MLSDYIPILVMFVFVFGFAAFSLIITHIFGPRRAGREKLEPYESGMPPLGETHRRTSVKYYLFAMFFIIFDVEVIFLYPWAVIFKKYVADTPLILMEMFTFLIVLIVGLVYVWRKGGLEWE